MNINKNIGSKDSITRKTVEGGFWMLVASAGYKSVSLVRTFILARLLIPDDFGLFGIAMVAVNGLSLFTETGANALLIQKKELDERYWNTGWFISAIRGIILFLVLWLVSSHISDFYNQSRLTLILRLLSFHFLLQGFNNIGLVALQKNMQFKKKVALDQLAELAGNICAIALGIIYQNIWALVFGKLITSATLFILSFMWLADRPKFSFSSTVAKEFFIFGKSVAVTTILVYIITNVDDLIVGKVVGIAMLGYYTMAYNIANLPTVNISRTVAQVTFPAFSQIKDEPRRIRQAFVRVFGYNILACLPISAALIVLAPEFIEIVLGSKWLPMTPALQILSLLGLFRGTASIIGPLLMGMGRPEYLRNIKLFEFILFAPFIYPVAKFGGIVGVSWFTTIIYLLSFILHLVSAEKLVPGVREPSLALFGIVASCTALMSAGIIAAKSFYFISVDLAGLIIMIILAVILYVPLSWLLVSRYLRSYIALDKVNQDNGH